ncbi:sigma-70 family RNA polymerase sigma factor [Sphingobacterium sp. DK4209]|uniref:Sigma-70 family RNA polymerase sigma factor n=1 Tax=Sphingobacterium zhuxiongii TaxID=2662364 RepID=A0A5Q0QJ14_9SPHI|nr:MULTISPECIES: sigma-70 family RNA polymerase sigma factor [unclassified Sphingobacterium]MVZ65797.1 sigma-70 family RNA polymerase sigma factor [Sphingobacterium sp. DK4209]QGA27992.1 sigma-70 family RNA polymerase sigma factor [Sphingobacterium sp. dk4302]
MTTHLEVRVKELFDQYFISLVEFSWHFVKCHDTALDIVQDTFVKILDKNIALPDHENAVKSYLYTAVRNASLNYTRHLKISEAYNLENPIQEVSDEDVLDAIISAEALNKLYTAIQSLPKGCQEVCRLTYLEGKSNSEVAELCGVSINTIKTQKKRSLELLRGRLSPSLATLKNFILLFF